MNEPANGLKMHYSNPKFDGLPWAIDRTSKGKLKRHRNSLSEDTATKILLAFESGGIVPLDPEKFAEVREHVRGILARAMETKKEKRRRKWSNFQRARRKAVRQCN